MLRELVNLLSKNSRIKDYKIGNRIRDIEEREKKSQFFINVSTVFFNIYLGA